MEQKSFLYSSSPEEFRSCTNSDTPVARDRWNLFPSRSTTSKVDNHSNASFESISSRHQFCPTDKIDSSFYYKVRLMTKRRQQVVFQNSHKHQNGKRRSSFSSYKPRSQFDLNTKFQPMGHDSNYLASFAVSDKEQNHADTCSPRVHNLQKEMDLLRTEIQRLKTIDINTYSMTKTRHKTTKEGQSSEMVKECKKWTTASNKSTKTKLGNNTPLHDYKVLNSDDSESEEGESDDFKGFVTKLKQERIQSCNQSSGSATSESFETVHTQGCGGQSFKSGVQRNQVEHDECRKLKEQVAENQTLLNKQQEDLQHLHNVLQRKDLELRDWAEKWSEHERTQHQKLVRRHTLAVQCDDKSQIDLIQTGTQCDSPLEILDLQNQVETSKEELQTLRTIVKELQASNDSLKEQNRTLRETDSIGEQLLRNEASEGQSFDSTSNAQKLAEILEDVGVPHSTIAEIIQRASEIAQQWSLNNEVTTSETSIRDSSLEHQKLQLQEELQLLRSTHQNELQHLNEEKESLMQKIVGLRKLVKKEAAEKEAAQAALAKHVSSIKDQIAEVEQSRVLIQQKKQQVSELEDSLAMMQHENENWERDYSILMRKNEKLERQLQLARKIETNFNGVMQNQT